MLGGYGAVGAEVVAELRWRRRGLVAGRDPAVPSGWWTSILRRALPWVPQM